LGLHAFVAGDNKASLAIVEGFGPGSAWLCAFLINRGEVDQDYWSGNHIVGDASAYINTNQIFIIEHHAYLDNQLTCLLTLGWQDDS
jgi:hypothetical protein